MKNKLNHIISIILSSIITITLLTACEKTESVAEETTVSETTAATIPADLTEEEMAIWESMPDIVTMRVYNDYETETTEILYIEKSGTIKSFVSDEYYEGYKDSEWIANKIKTSQASVIDKVDIHKLIELYDDCLSINRDNKMIMSEFHKLCMEYDVTFRYEVYFNINNSDSSILFLGQTATAYFWNDEILGKSTCLLYMEIDKKISFF